MPEQTAASAVVVEKQRRARKPRPHWLERDPPPPIRVFTIDQIEAEHPGLKGRIRQWIARADASDPDFRWLKLAVIRVGRSVFVDDVKFRDGLHQRAAMPPAPSRLGGQANESDA